MMDLTNFIIKEALYLLPVLWVIAGIIKSTPKVPSWTIPYILIIIGIVLAVWTLGFNAQAIAQGVLLAGAAVLGHQLIKQARTAKEDDNPWQTKQG